MLESASVTYGRYNQKIIKIRTEVDHQNPVNRLIFIVTTHTHTHRRSAMAMTTAKLRKELHRKGIKTYYNKKTKASYVKKADVKIFLTAEIDDYNGLWEKFEAQFPKIAKKLSKEDQFWDGINSVSELKAGGKDFLFIETPGHGWIVDMEGEMVGEEDGGFDDESLNSDLDASFKNMKEIIS